MGKSGYFRLTFFLYWLALMLCLGCRILLKLFHTDPQTGFYTMDSPLIWVFNITLPVASALMLLINRLKRVDNEYPIVREGRGLGTLAVFTGVTLALYVLESTGWAQITSHPGLPLKGIRVVICGVLGMLAALSVFTIGLMGVTGYRRSPWGLLAIAPTLWMLVTLVAKFNSYTVLTTVADNLLAVLFMVFGAVFATGHARTLCGFARKNGRNYMIPAGLLTSLMGILLVIPNYLCRILYHTEMPAACLGDMESIFVLCFSVYALAAVIHLRRCIASV